MVLEAGKLYKKTGNTFVEVTSEEFVAPALTDALEMQQNSDAPVPTAQAFLNTLALNNLTIQNYSGNVTPVEGDTKQVSDSGQIRFYKYTSGAWVEVGGFNGNNLQFKNDGLDNIIIGYDGPSADFGGLSNVILGDGAGRFLKEGTGVRGDNNVLIGKDAGRGNPDATFSDNLGSDLIAIGTKALYNNAGGHNNVALGNDALGENTGGSLNVGIGHSALRDNQVGTTNVAVGFSALRSLTSTVATANTAIGYAAASGLLSGTFNTALGYQALTGTTPNGVTNSTGVGNGANVTGSNQVQLGNSSTTTYVYGTVQNRSDQRDKAEIKDTELGLDFILKLHPVDYKWDMREDYIILDNEGNVTELPKDGSKKRSRFHHGFIAQEVKTIIDETSKDFGGYQDHSVKGGKDVLSIGYDEFIAPMVKAMQEMYQEMQTMKEEIATLRERVASLEGVSE